MRRCSAEGKLFRPAPCLIVFAALLYKALYLAAQTQPDDWTAYVHTICLNDFVFIGVVLALSSCACFFRAALLSRLFASASWLLALIYLVDLAVIVEIDSRFSFADLAKFGPEVRQIAEFFRFWHLILLVLLALLWCWRVNACSIRRGLLALACVCGLLGTAFGSDITLIGRYSFDLSRLFPVAAVRLPVDEPYTQGEIDFFRRSFPPKPLITLPKPGTSVVLVIVESLSAVDSFKTSGLQDRLPNFDRIAADGTLFTNFFSNFRDTEGAVIALLNATLPLPYAGSTRQLYRSFAGHPSVVDALKRENYYTIMLTTGALSFLQKETYLRELKFDEMEGGDTLPAFINAPHYAFNHASDEVLYREALSRIDRRLGTSQPFFLVMLTGSSHTPNVDPLGRGNTEENVWNYVDTQFAYLYRELVAKDYFKQGLLIILGDHRKFLAVSSDEEEKYGRSSIARVPLLIVGAGIERGRIDQRYFQQADLFPKLGSMSDTRSTLSRWTVLVAQYSIFGSLNDKGNLLIFPEHDRQNEVYRARLEGRSLQWFGNPPHDAHRLAAYLHSVRAKHQDDASRVKEVSAFDGPLALPAPSEEHGLIGAMFVGTEIEHALEDSSPRYLGCLTMGKAAFVANGNSQILPPSDFALRLQAHLSVEQAGKYWFRVMSDDGVSLALDGKMLIAHNRRQWVDSVETSLYLEAGLHPLEIRYSQYGGIELLGLEWIAPGADSWSPVPPGAFVMPQNSKNGQCPPLDVESPN